MFGPVIVSRSTTLACSLVGIVFHGGTPRVAMLSGLPLRAYASRVALSRAGNVYARFMLGLPVHDATSGYRVYRRELLEQLLARPFGTDGYGFQIELVMRAHRLGFDVGEAPITFRERIYGTSKISNAIVAEALWMVTRWGCNLRFGTRPPA